MASFHILTFGCKVNQCDSQILRETLTSWGLTDAGSAGADPGETGDRQKDDRRGADLLVINTCTVTSTADAKFRKALRRTRRENPDDLIAVTGCYVNTEACTPEGLPEADLVFGMRDFSRLAELLRHRDIVGADAAEGARTQSYFAEHTRAFLKIQDGCDCFCAYCVVPLVRPELWSEEPGKVVAAINNLSSRGYKEAVLTGIHLGFYGRGAPGTTLGQLLGMIEKECEIDRIRLSSIEIHEISDGILELIAGSNKFCHHLHLPLQSGDDEILRKMGRKYSSASFVERVRDIRERIPDMGITTDVIVGFPGETEKQFERTMQLIRDMEFAKIHVFRFSPRPATEAAKLDSPVPPATVSSRARKLIRLGEDTARKFKERFIGKTFTVLTESRANNGNACIGLTSNYIRVKVLNVSADHLNRILPVRLDALDTDTGVAVGRLE